MSKYIRTKNRIYQVESILRDNGFVKGYNVGEMAFIRKDQVIDQAETINALCDEFVWDKLIIEFRDKTHFHYENDDFIFELNESILKEGIYGAIWVTDDNGAPILKSVSKMINMEGELELL